MKFCPMCGSSQDDSKSTICGFCDYQEKPFNELSKQEIDELMLPFEYEVIDGGVKIVSVKNIRIRGCVAIPHFVTEIASNAFAFCKFISRVDLPKGLRYIGEGAFMRCSSLTSVTIPSGVTSIGTYAFYNCSGLTNITINATTPPTLSNINAFTNTNDCPIYVPSGSVDTYKAASKWSTYASRIQAIPT